MCLVHCSSVAVPDTHKVLWCSDTTRWVNKRQPVFHCLLKLLSVWSTGLGSAVAWFMVWSWCETVDKLASAEKHLIYQLSIFGDA